MCIYHFGVLFFSFLFVHVPPGYRFPSSLNMSCSAALWVVNSHGMCMPEKALALPLSCWVQNSRLAAFLQAAQPLCSLVASSPTSWLSFSPLLLSVRASCLPLAAFTISLYHRLSLLLLCFGFIGEVFFLCSAPMRTYCCCSGSFCFFCLFSWFNFTWFFLLRLQVPYFFLLSCLSSGPSGVVFSRNPVWVFLNIFHVLTCCAQLLLCLLERTGYGPPCSLVLTLCHFY